MSVEVERGTNGQELVDACLRALDIGIRQMVCHTSNYTVAKVTENSVELAFKNKYVFQHVIQELCCRLTGLNMSQVLSRFGTKHVEEKSEAEPIFTPKNKIRKGPSAD